MRFSACPSGLNLPTPAFDCGRQRASALERRSSRVLFLLWAEVESGSVRIDAHPPAGSWLDMARKFPQIKGRTMDRLIRGAFSPEELAYLNTCPSFATLHEQVKSFDDFDELCLLAEGLLATWAEVQLKEIKERLFKLPRIGYI
jgi:hypothetical protein